MLSAAHQSLTIGILGGGQLGLMLSESLCNLGAQVRILEPSSHSPASARTPFVTQGAFDDETTLRNFFAQCDRVTYEFEHIPTRALKNILAEQEHRSKLWPSLTVLEYSQNRITEKTALSRAGVPLAKWSPISTLEELKNKKQTWSIENREAILKTAAGGYDGKGQWRLNSIHSWDECIQSLAQQPSIFPMVLEEKCDLQTELSVIVGRHPTLGTYVFPAFENIHSNGILDTTLHPPRVDFELCQSAQKIAEHIADAWDVFGLLCVEFFVVNKGQSSELLVNEVAPRPHNSGHVTRRSMTRSQFDLLAQILLDLPFGSQATAPEHTWCMWNTLGDLWSQHNSHQAIQWPSELLAHNALCEALLYGKSEARTGRKMGHVILRAPTPDKALQTARHFRSYFNTKHQGGRT